MKSTEIPWVVASENGKDLYFVLYIYYVEKLNENFTKEGDSPVSIYI